MASGDGGGVRTCGSRGKEVTSMLALLEVALLEVLAVLGAAVCVVVKLK